MQARAGTDANTQAANKITSRCIEASLDRSLAQSGNE
jgi:hypothetical protein